MILPIQSPPLNRKPSTAKIFNKLTGVELSQNRFLQCQLCCAMDRGDLCNVVIPGCRCDLFL